MKNQIVGALSLLLIPAFANAFTLNTDPSIKGWEGGKVEIWVNTANCPEDVVRIVQDAIVYWNNVPTSSVKLSYGGTKSAAGGAQNPPLVWCATSYASIGGSPDPDYVPGAASVGTAGGRIAAGHIFLNATSGNANISNFPYAMNVITMAHEMGHLLGLGHSHTDTALMYYDGSYRDQRYLGQDDIDGISYRYPSNEMDDKKFAGCGSINMSLPPPPTKPNLALFLFLLLPLLTFLGLQRRPTLAKTRKSR